MKRLLINKETGDKIRNGHTISRRKKKRVQRVSMELKEMDVSVRGSKPFCSGVKAGLIQRLRKALRIQEETAREPIKAWETDNTLLVPGKGGSDSKLGSEDTQKLEQHLEGTLYTRVLEICRYVKKTY